jgi:hypothetical protein
MLIPTFDHETGQCISLHWQTPDNQYILIPIRRNGDRAEANPDDPNYGYLAQQIVDSPEYLELDLSDRTPEPQPSSEILSQEDWSNLVTLLQTSEIFSRVLLLGTQFLDVNMAVTWLMSVVTSVKSIESLQKSVGFLRLALVNHGADLTAEEMQFIAESLAASGFDPSVLVQQP